MSGDLVERRDLEAVLVLTSFCADRGENEGFCSNRHPCLECLSLSNTAFVDRSDLFGERLNNLAAFTGHLPDRPELVESHEFRDTPMAEDRSGSKDYGLLVFTGAFCFCLGILLGVLA